MTIKKVWIEHGCIAAGYCNEVCPEVFGLDDFGESFIEDDAVYNSNETCIKEAAKVCPVKIIKFAEE
ncbi:MAG: ferredoxin [Salinivirgaceae bacterium]